MRFTTATTLATLAALASAGKDKGTFAVLRFNGKNFLTEGPMDPVVDPGRQATHYHAIQGGSNFALTVEGDQLLDSNCTTAKINKDFSNYWVPHLFFQDPKDGTFEKVPLFYMNVYYFFEASDLDVEPFPPGLKMLTGDSKRTTPPKSGGALQLDPSKGEINAIQFTCPRSSYDPPSYPADSDGSMAGIQDPNNKGAGAGFPLYECDGYGSPLRQDMHFPSCYNPEVGLDDYQNNMAWGTSENGKMVCPPGHKLVPHLFYEVYWDTPQFKDRWTPDGKTQPFVLSNGDRTGYSSHGDFIAGWHEETLQKIIDTCNAGSLGMDHCPDIPGGLNDDESCSIAPAIGNILKSLTPATTLPLGLKPFGWGVGSGPSEPESEPVNSSQPAAGKPSSSPSPSMEAAATPSPSPVKVEEVSTSAAPVVPVVPTNIGGAFLEKPTVSAEPEAAAVTPAPAPASPAAPVDPNVEIVWDVVTVTQTTTVAPEPSPFRRRAPRNSHGHLARHLHGGR